MSGQPVTAMCNYRVQPGKEADIQELLKRHGPALEFPSVEEVAFYPGR